MLELKTTLSLATLQAAGSGFIVNARRDRIVLHRAGCEAVSAMVTAAYPKTYFDDAEEALMYLEGQYGAGDWENCGKCGGASAVMSF
jgi:hypothetical protein